MELRKFEIDANQELDIKINTEEKLSIPEGVDVYEIDGPYFFGIANKFEEVMSRISKKPKVRIIRMRRVPFMDSTGIHNLEVLIEQSKKEGVQIVLSGVNPNVRTALEKAEFTKLIPTENICSTIPLLIGAPVRNTTGKGKPLFNAAVFLHQGKRQIFKKKNIGSTRC